MSKKRIGLYPTDNSIYPKKEKVVITGLKDEKTFIYRNAHDDNAKGLLPFYRFSSEEECSHVQINSEVTIYRYFNASGKRLVAYHVRYEQ
jgi:hypothetical protein